MNKFTILSRICSSWEKLKHREHVVKGQKKEEKDDEERGMEEKKGGQAKKTPVSTERHKGDHVITKRFLRRKSSTKSNVAERSGKIKMKKKQQ